MESERELDVNYARVNQYCKYNHNRPSIVIVIGTVATAAIQLIKGHYLIKLLTIINGRIITLTSAHSLIVE